MVQIALTPGEAALFRDEWDALVAELVAGGHDAEYTGWVGGRSGDAMAIEPTAALTLDPGMTSRDLSDVLQRCLKRTQEGRTRTIAIYGPTGLLEKRVDVGA
jgi:hypothetical protein